MNILSFIVIVECSRKVAWAVDPSEFAHQMERAIAAVMPRVLTGAKHVAVHLTELPANYFPADPESRCSKVIRPPADRAGKQFTG